VRLKSDHPAVTEGRTLFPKQIREPLHHISPILKPASNNTKLGGKNNIITKGTWKGFPLFSLTLPERSTCPNTCERWQECYGNAMPFAHRFNTDGLIPRLESELVALSKKHTAGFAIRLHVLGDFYSVDYVSFWERMLRELPNLHIYGYTAHTRGPINDRVDALRILYPNRFWIRHSTSSDWRKDTPYRIFAAREGFTAGIVCPEQTGKTDSCLSCGLCWSVNRTILFRDHDTMVQERKHAQKLRKFVGLDAAQS